MPARLLVVVLVVAGIADVEEDVPGGKGENVPDGEGAKLATGSSHPKTLTTFFFVVSDRVSALLSQSNIDLLFGHFVQEGIILAGPIATVFSDQLPPVVSSNRTCGTGYVLFAILRELVRRSKVSMYRKENIPGQLYKPPSPADLFERF
ncbi:hypothetical protein BJ170DRAFT_685442 [Xylariales sp. AK1849]|nr:hypothetical protein BJ170DRAFT_685442 [Xylariales sp. AK1849]